MTVRVLLLSPGISRHGGAERCLVGLLDGLAGTEVQARVAVFGEGDLVDHLRERGDDVSVVPVAHARPAGRYRGAVGVVSSLTAAMPAVPAAVRRLRAEIREFDPDIAHSNGTRANVLLPFLRRNGTRSVASLHDVPVTATERRIMSAALRRVDAVIANSPMVSRLYADAGVSCEIIDNPVPAPASRDRGAARRRFGVPDDAFLIAGLAHLHWYKGQLDLVRAMDELHESCHLLLAGGPLYGPPSFDYLARVRHAVEGSAAAYRIHLVGLQDDVSWVYAAADLVVHSSIRPEPFGMVIVEALLTGTAVVSTTAGTPGEMLQDGLTALLYAPGDVPALVRSVEALRADPGRREQLGREGRVWASRFAPERHARSVLATYARLLAAPRQAPPPPAAPTSR